MDLVKLSALKSDELWDGVRGAINSAGRWLCYAVIIGAVGLMGVVGTMTSETCVPLMIGLLSGAASFEAKLKRKKINEENVTPADLGYGASTGSGKQPGTG